MESLLRWIDADASRHTALGLTALALTTALALWPLRRPRGLAASGWWFAAAVLLTLAAFRWPIWLAPYELNPDESQAIAGARTLLDYPVYWKYVDGTTHGPLVEFFLVLFGWLGLPLNFVTARVAGTLLQGLALLGAWGALRRGVSESAARLAILPALAFWSFVHWGDFVHYSTELVPVALIGGALWAGAEGLARDLARRSTLAWLLLAGALLGAVPLGKLQLVPLALVAGGTLLLALWQRRREAGATTAIGTTIAGALLPAAGLGVYLAAFGLGPQFMAAYVESNLGYVEGKPVGLADMASDFFSLIAQGQSFAWFIVPAVLYAAWHGRQVWRESTAGARVLLLAGWIALAVGYWSVITPGRMLSHYLQVLLLPLTLLAGGHFALELDRRRAAGGRWGLVVVVFLAVTVAPQIVRHLTGSNVYLGRFDEHRQAPVHPVSAYLKTHARPADRLAMWGWLSQVWVETGLPQGTREAHTAYQLNQTPLRSFYRDRYLRDMQRRLPEWFVDAVAPGSFGYTDRRVDGHETFPELAGLIRAHYECVVELGGVRIYHLKRAR